MGHWARGVGFVGWVGWNWVVVLLIKYLVDYVLVHPRGGLLAVVNGLQERFMEVGLLFSLHQASPMVVVTGTR